MNGGDGWNGFAATRLTLRARFARLSAGKPASDEPPSVVPIRPATRANKKGHPDGAPFSIDLVVMGGIEPPTYGL